MFASFLLLPFSSSSAWLQLKAPIFVVPARPEQQAQDQSGQADLDCERWIAAVPAGPKQQPARSGSERGLGPNHKEFSKIHQIECQKERRYVSCRIHLPNRLLIRRFVRWNSFPGSLNRKKSNYFSSSHPHHDMSGHVRTYIWAYV